MKSTPAKRAPVALPRVIAWIALAILLLILGMRLTSPETLRETLAQKSGRLMQEQALTQKPDAVPPPPFVGPAFIAAYAAITCALASVLTFLAGRRGGGGGAGGGGLTRFRLSQLALMALLIALSAISAFRSVGRFSAIVGTADLLASLAAAWTVALACHEHLLGVRGRQVTIAAILAILTITVVKGHIQHFIEFPEEAQMINGNADDPGLSPDEVKAARENRDRLLRENGINPENEASRKLFMARLKSAEVFGYGGMSNVYATQIVADIILLAALGMAGLLFLARAGRPTESQPPGSSASGNKGRPSKGTSPQPGAPMRVEVPLHLIALVAVGILLFAGLVVLLFTESKGAAAAAAIALAIVIAGGSLWRLIIRHQRLLRRALAAATVLFPAVVIAYGLARHTLPSRSLAFRWQYWTGAWDIITRHPLWGVGLNNFGSYYLQFKHPSWPEDVSDPHSFFVRFAAEVGIPGLVVVVLLLILMFRAALVAPPSGGTGAASATDATVSPPFGLRKALVNAGLVALAWIPFHFLTEAPVEYTVFLAVLLTTLAWAVFVGIMALQSALTPRGNRYVALGAAAAALAMLLYDQVNMALVTGPVAMLFWILLAVADDQGFAGPAAPLARSASNDAVHRSVRPSTRLAHVPAILALVGTALSIAIIVLLLLPITQDDGPWDPAPSEFRSLLATSGKEQLANLNAAIERAPMSGELLIQRFELERRFHLPAADDARRILDLDRANASTRLVIALPDSDLPPAERYKALEDALVFDQALAPDEPKRLTPLQLAEVRVALARMPAYAWFYHP